jgi:hypothetical protein
MSGRNAELGGLLIVRGRPRYWIGVARAGPPSMEATVCCRSGGIAIGRKPLLYKLMLSPDNSPKMLSNVMISLRLRAWAGVMMTVSSANCRCDVVADGKWIRSFCSLWTIACRESVVRMKKSGDKGSPWRRPFMW